jgi:hypothetical protein
VYDRFHPDLVVDMQEFRALPLVASDGGWWRAEYWDLLVGAGRAPWAAAALRDWCRHEVDTVVLPALDKDHVRAEHAMLPSGSFDTTSRFASNATDYFLVRGTPAFVFQSAGGDGGEGSAGKRAHNQRVALDALLADLSAQADRWTQVQATATGQMATMTRVTLSVTAKPYTIKLMGTTGEQLGFEGKIDVAGHTYRTHASARFEGLDYEVRTTAPMPAAFRLETNAADYVQLLALHGLPCSGTVGTYSIPASPLAGLLFLPAVQELAPDDLPVRGLVSASGAAR